MKIKFLTNLSHEFRTPISLIKGPVDTMLGQMENGKIAEQLKLVKRNSERLLSLVNQLLDYRKMEENEIHLQDTDGEFVSFVKQSVASFTDLAIQKGIDLSVSSSCEKMYVRFDKDKVERILFNLLSNAFKFTPLGGKIAVTVDASHAITDADTVQMNVAVKDTGIGIPL
ncbi:HAMP domain-containing histidine kinase, partial [Brucella sp. 21LCYQ03]|nr:HAMP domain-containing histidine kinase [Brucella sp. 21LCYQ03]